MALPGYGGSGVFEKNPNSRVREEAKEEAKRTDQETYFHIQWGGAARWTYANPFLTDVPEQTGGKSIISSSSRKVESNEETGKNEGPNSREGKDG